MKKLAAYLLLLIVFTACNNQKNKTNDTTNITSHDTLTYSYKKIQVYHSPVKKQRDTTFAAINYPLFKDENLNEYIKRQVFDFFDPQEKATSYQDIANSFVNGYNDFIKENTDSEQAWYLKIHIKVVRQHQNYIAIAYQHEDYAGGAHGNAYTAFLNYNLSSHTPITIDTLFEKKDKSKLLEIAEKVFKKNEGLTPTQSLTENYFFENGKFDLAKNFYISNKGLVFLYNNYEIKPYVNGTTELIIPFTEIKNMTNPKSFLSTLF